ncbi:hypothetical protein BHM03_00034367 [Ensete ventricosum]|nr:hypothetical protein BHM03_00034367 [Ensete ventricosum]
MATPTYAGGDDVYLFSAPFFTFRYQIWFRCFNQLIYPLNLHFTESIVYSLFSMATSPTCLTRSLDKPNLVKRSRLLASDFHDHSYVLNCKVFQINNSPAVSTNTHNSARDILSEEASCLSVGSHPIFSCSLKP